MYRLFDHSGVLLYVGITGQPKVRFAQHARDKAWWHEVDRWRVEWHSDRNAAEAEEVRLIQEEMPLRNIQRFVPSGPVQDVDVTRTGPGRPKVGGLVRDARLGDDLLARVEQLAADAGASRSEMLRTLVAEAVARRDAESHDVTIRPRGA